MFLRQRCARAGGAGARAQNVQCASRAKHAVLGDFELIASSAVRRTLALLDRAKTLNLIPPRKGDWIERQKCRAQKARFARLQKSST